MGAGCGERTHNLRMRIDKVLLLLPAATFLWEASPAYAYLDPGTGSMLLSVFVGLISGAYFLIRKLPAAARSLFFRLTGKTDVLKADKLTFYAESATYWPTFRPVLAELEKAGFHSTYLTSDENDPVFKSGFKCVTARYIGKANTAYTVLGFLQSRVCVLTTPGLDVLQLRRSKGVKKYIHIVHAAGDIHTYKLFSFDYFDAVYCSGPAQAASLRSLEGLRGTRPKDLPLLGCPYLDGFLERAQEASVPDKQTVLIAPTWGRNGLLTRTGSLVPKLLLQAGFHVILRPHPQSFVSDKELMNKLAEELSGCENIEWDRNPDGFSSLSRAALVVSDISGVIFDFAFIFLRPVISIGNGPQKDGFEAWDLPQEAWEMSALEDLGARILPGSEEDVVRIARELIENEGRAKEKILEIRSRNVVNFGRAAGPIAGALIKEVESAR